MSLVSSIVTRGIDVAREAVASLRRPLRPSVAPSWRLDRAALAGAELRWPARYGWSPTAIWLDPLVDAMAAHVRVRRAELAQTRYGVVEAEWEVAGRRWPIAFDYSDYLELDEQYASTVAVYFKMVHRVGGYGIDSVVTAGYVPSRPRYYRILAAARRERDRGRRRFDVYGRFSLAYAPQVRRRAVELLQAQERFSYEGGLRLARYSRSLREAAQARVCLDLPGNGDVTHRLPEYLGIGICVVRPRPLFEFPVPLEDGKHVVFCAPDLSDLVDVCARMASDHEAREAVARQARDYFDRYLHRDQLATYYLHTLTARLIDLDSDAA
jgi:Glycosyl transferases group 1